MDKYGSEDQNRLKVFSTNMHNHWPGQEELKVNNTHFLAGLLWMHENLGTAPGGHRSFQEQMAGSLYHRVHIGLAWVSQKLKSLRVCEKWYSQKEVNAQSVVTAEVEERFRCVWFEPSVWQKS